MIETRDLQEIASSGELLEIYLNGVLVANKVITKGEVDTLLLNVPKLNAGNVFVGSNDFQSGVTVLSTFELIPGATFIMPDYVDNVAALADGYNIGNVYKTPTGEVRIVI